MDISGRTRVGYEVDLLIRVLEDFLGFTNLHKAYLFGVGSLGGALLRDSGLSHFGLQIVGAFDINPSLVGTTVEGIPIYHTDEFEARRAKDGVKIGVLTVPINIAQDITDKMVAEVFRQCGTLPPSVSVCRKRLSCKIRHCMHIWQ